MLTSPLLLFLAAYAIGSTPFGLLVALAAGRIDIRKHGSGNIGATNVGRVLGSKWGLLVLVLDALKGFLPALLLPRLFFSDPDSLSHVVAGVGTIVGHMFPVWLGFRGGKGVATALGVVLCLGPIGSAVAAFAFFALFVPFRIVSLSSIAAALAFAVTQLMLLSPTPFSAENRGLAIFSLLVPGLIILRHRTNIVRLWRGEEPRYEFRRKTPSVS